MKNFLVALQFLTIIPVKLNNIDEKGLRRSVAYFPLVGLLLGVILAAANSFLSFLKFERFFIDIALVVSLIILTGGIHLDGLSDTADALFSGKPREEMLKIMRDSSIGAMGALAIVVIILLKIAFLSSLTLSYRPRALILMCVLSRWAMVLSMSFFPYARREGKARVFIQGASFKVFLFSTVIAVIISTGLWKAQGVLVAVYIGAISWVLSKFITKKIGGITGDTLGAANELTEVAVLIGLCMLERGGLWMIGQ